jgi:hypothetical protein
MKLLLAESRPESNARVPSVVDLGCALHEPV